MAKMTNFSPLSYIVCLLTALKRWLLQYAHTEVLPLSPPFVAVAATRFEIEPHKVFSHCFVLEKMVTNSEKFPAREKMTTEGCVAHKPCW